MNEIFVGSVIEHSFTVKVARDNGYTASFPSRSTVLTNTRQRSGVNLPNYKELINTGKNATTKFSASRTTAVFHPGSFDIKWTYNSPAYMKQFTRYWSDGGINASWPRFDSAVPVVSSNTDALALSRFYGAIRNQHSEFQGLIFLGELHETIKMLRNPLQSLRERILQYMEELERRLAGVPKRGTASIYRKRLRDVAAETWLEYSFGMVPLVSDIRGVIMALKRIGERNLRKKVSGTAREGYTNTSTTVVFDDSGACRFQSILTNTVEISVRYIGVYDPALDSPRNQIQSLLGFRLEDIPSAAWELMPWSFLLDYFVNIGKLIEAYTTNTSAVLWSAKTVRTEKSVIRTVQTDWAFAVGWKVNSGLSAYQLGFKHTPEIKGFVRKTVERDAFSITPPPLTLTMPTSISKWVNMAALAVQGKHLSSRFPMLR